MKMETIKHLAAIVFAFAILNASAAEILDSVQGKVTNTEITKHEKRQIECLTEALWFEGRSEGWYGMFAIANVIHNRVKSSKYPNTHCKVISQNKQFSYKHQLKDPTIHAGKVPSFEKKVYNDAKHIATIVVKEQFTPMLPKEAMWYHADYVKPRWAKHKQKVNQIGRHIFYLKPKKS